jgi:hypothetical protein
LRQQFIPSNAGVGHKTAAKVVLTMDKPTLLTDSTTAASSLESTTTNTTVAGNSRSRSNTTAMAPNLMPAATFLSARGCADELRPSSMIVQTASGGAKKSECHTNVITFKHIRLGTLEIVLTYKSTIDRDIDGTL